MQIFIDMPECDDLQVLSSQNLGQYFVGFVLHSHACIPMPKVLYYIPHLGLRECRNCSRANPVSGNISLL